jgi:hypothetical protein
MNILLDIYKVNKLQSKGLIFMKDIHEEANKRRNDKYDISLEQVLYELNFSEQDCDDIKNMIENDIKLIRIRAK